MTLADAAAVVGDSSALGVEDAIHAAVLGRRPELERALDRLLAEGEAPVRLIAAAASDLMRLLRLSVVAAGGSIEAAVAGARPPIFWRQRPVRRRRSAAGRRTRLAAGLALLQAAELRCKSGGGTPDVAAVPRRIGAARRPSLPHGGAASG